METVTRDLVNDHLSTFIDVIEEDGKFVWLFNKMMTNAPINWSTRSTFPSHKDAMETGIAYIRHNYPDLVKDAVKEATEGVKYRNKIKRDDR